MRCGRNVNTPRIGYYSIRSDSVRKRAMSLSVGRGLGGGASALRLISSEPNGTGSVTQELIDHFLEGDLRGHLSHDQSICWLIQCCGKIQ